MDLGKEGELSAAAAPQAAARQSTLDNLVDVFARDAQTFVRYRCFASTAKHEGLPGAAALFERLAQAQAVVVEGHFDFLRQLGDPLTNLPVGATQDNLRAALTAEREEAEELCRAVATVAEAEGFPSVASWFHSVAALKRSHLLRIEGLLAVADVAGRPEEGGYDHAASAD
ncbi:rubrerythrin family protein [Azospirillum sp. B506]|uniref:rubrerythrin family protein n=1 Tax=Azospirillum sp. B506 TaxID=137721 RepID=UPI0003465DDB|nr:rubrerythrin family protein [Azospirillum sp. B506]